MRYHEILQKLRRTYKNKKKKEKKRKKERKIDKYKRKIESDLLMIKL